MSGKMHTGGKGKGKLSLFSLLLLPYLFCELNTRA